MTVKLKDPPSKDFVDMLLDKPPRTIREMRVLLAELEKWWRSTTPPKRWSSQPTSTWEKQRKLYEAADAVFGASATHARSRKA